MFLIRERLSALYINSKGNNLVTNVSNEQPGLCGRQPNTVCYMNAISKWLSDKDLNSWMAVRLFTSLIVKKIHCRFSLFALSD